MARLIDADALRLMKVEECAGHSIEYAMGWKACIEWIKDATTIDAIPVEWLREKRKYASEGDSLDVGIAEVLDMWEKEQEAQDGTNR